MQKQINYAFLLAIALNAFLWWSGISLIGSTIKTFGDCNKEYKIDKYINTNWFCETEDSMINATLARSETIRARRR